MAGRELGDRALVLIKREAGKHADSTFYNHLSDGLAVAAGFHERLCLTYTPGAALETGNHTCFSCFSWFSSLQGMYWQLLRAVLIHQPLCHQHL